MEKMSDTMKRAMDIVRQHGKLVVSRGFKTSPATLVPEMDAEVEQDRYTPQEWKTRAVNRQTVNKLVNMGMLQYEDPDTVIVPGSEKVVKMAPGSKPVMSIIRDQSPEKVIEKAFRWMSDLRSTSRPDYDLGYARAQMDLRKILIGEEEDETDREREDDD